MQKKFALTNETRVFNNQTLYRIQALRDFDDVKAGALGGFIENESNLSHDGNCWIYDNALVLNPAHIYENAKVFNNAIIMGSVYGNAHVCDRARVYANAHVYDNAHLSYNAWVYHQARVYGNAKLSGNARIHSKAVVYDHAVVSGAAKIYGKVYGNASVGCHTDVYGSARLKRDSDLYWVPINCEVYENDTVVKIIENNAA
ncbi:MULTISPECIES: hypothetical protein [unclassified Bartonella]|uniref:hypothetical protein n=1 Tax=unclassified Bartonella TaxID=2645622 RepID=UPI0035CF8E67